MMGKRGRIALSLVAAAGLAALRARPATALELRYEPRPALTHATIYHPTAWEALQALYPRPAE